VTRGRGGERTDGGTGGGRAGTEGAEQRCDGLRGRVNDIATNNRLV
jgi:hypothetical protein